jgi:hypothetical protein
MAETPLVMLAARSEQTDRLIRILNPLARGRTYHDSVMAYMTAVTVGR